MPRLDVQHCLRDFELSLNESLNLLAESNAYRVQNPRGTYIHIGSRRKEIFASIALLRMHMSWEDFLENVFVRFLCGGQTASGYSPSLLQAPFSIINTAYSTLLGGNNFLNWSPYNINTLALRFFNLGEPFSSAIAASRNKLDEINIVRNRFAHRSDFASNQFEIIIRNTLGYIPRGINPGRWLLMRDPSNPGLRLIDGYAIILRVTARSIVR
ncbi:MAG: hypothetical protein KBF64_03215 [Anaerolineaceae bacterium]|nr:hypothetical protein [Anaerolineaceae bacterium]